MLGKFTQISSETKRVVIDIETYDPFLKQKGVSWIYNEGFIIGIACKIDNEPTEYYPIRHEQDNYDREKCKRYFWKLFDLCYQYQIPVVCHYGYYDLGWLDHEEFINIGICPPLRDTLLGGQLYKSDMIFSLKMMAKFFGVGEKMEIDINKIFEAPVSLVDKYACNDVDLTGRIDDKLIGHLNCNRDAIIRENAITPILVMMKKNGIKINEERLNELEKDFEVQLIQIQKRIDEVYPGCKIWGNNDLEFLFRRLGLGYPRTEHGNPSFTADFLKGHHHPLIKEIAIARKLDRLKNGFIGGIKAARVNGRIHSDYFNGRSDGGGTITGRFSSANPNMQQVPRRTEAGMSVRSAFVPDSLAWFRADYSQQEPRLMLHYAALTKQPTIEKWQELYQINSDQDFYEVLMDITGKEREEMKTNTLALSYGMGKDHMAEIMGISRDEAEKFRTEFRTLVPWLPNLRDYVTRRALDKGEIKTLGGRHLKFVNSTLNKSFNHLIQGSAADQTKQAMVNIYKETGKVPLSQIHDELNFNMTEEDLENDIPQKIQQIMKDAVVLEFPVKVDISLGANWREACEK